MTGAFVLPGSPVTLTVLQSGSTLSGQWSGTGPDGPDNSTLEGTYAADGSVEMRWVASTSYTCAWDVRATVSGGLTTGHTVI